MVTGENELLLALARGWTLKSHRYLNGSKNYQLHPLDEGKTVDVAWETVEALRDKGLIDSNKKFPAATYLLTDAGRKAAEKCPHSSSSNQEPLTASGWE